MLMGIQMMLTVFIISIAFGTETEFQRGIILSVLPQIAHLCLVIPEGHGSAF